MRIKRISALLAAGILAGSGFCAQAAVYTVPQENAAPGTVYIAGNPDAYPVEFYDSKDETYRGVIPDLLEQVSEETGISFTYLASSTQNRQPELVRNLQVEMVTAIDPEDPDWQSLESVEVLSARIRGQEERYAVGFTDIADDSLRTTLENAFRDIPESRIEGLLIAYARQKNESGHQRIRSVLLGCLVVSSVAAFLAGWFLLRHLHRKKRKEESYLDSLTGAGNADYYTLAFDRLISRQAKNLYVLVCLTADSARLERIGDAKERERAEKLVAAHLNAACFSSEYLCRIRPGVFSMLLQIPQESECRQRIGRITEGLNDYLAGFYPHDRGLYHAGFCRLADHPEYNAETAFYDAEQSSKIARKNGTAVACGEEKQLQKSRREEALRRSLSRAMENGEFRVYMQIICRGETDQICGAEVLSRWQNPEYGMLQPAEYIEILKETGQIIPHDYRMFTFVCKLLELWQTSRYDQLFLTCNFTRVSLSAEDFADRITEISQPFRFDRHRLIIEITEDSLSTDSQIVSENIRRCREMGFQIAIDDMGTGFTSFSDLYDNELDLVKIESGFIAPCVSGRRRTMLSDIITMVHHSGAKVICEGVETAEQREMLRQIGCDMMQGYYYSRVLPYSECTRLLAETEASGFSFFPATEK